MAPGDPGEVLQTLAVMRAAQQRMEELLSHLAAEQQKLAGTISAASSPMASPSRSSTASHLGFGSLSSASSDGEDAAGTVPNVQAGVLLKIAEAEAAIGRANIVRPTEAKALLESNPCALFLDVDEDTDTPALPGVHKTSLGRLFLKASVDSPDRDPLISGRNKDELVLLIDRSGLCAKLAGKVMIDYGFRNVKVVNGGHIAWRECFFSQSCRLPMNWPASVPRRNSFTAGDESFFLGVDNPGNEADRPPEEERQFTESDTVMGSVRYSARSSFNGRTTSQLASLTMLPTNATPTPEKARFVLSPTSSLRVMVDAMSLCVLTYDALLVPWMLAWEVKMEGWLLAASVVTAVFWTMDLFLNFRTGFFTHGELQMSPFHICRHYLRTWFIPDLAMVVLDWVSIAMVLTLSPGGSLRVAGALRLAKWTRALRLLSIARFLRFSEVFERAIYRSYHSPIFLMLIQVWRLIFLIVYLNHLGACLWWSIGNRGDRYGSDTGSSWVMQEVANMGYSYREAEQQFQYVVSLHWAITKVLSGSMQIVATNSQEHLFSTACHIFRVLFLGTLLSSLASKMTELRMLHQERRAKVAQLRDFLRSKALGPDLAVNVIRQVDESLRDKRPDAVEQLKAWDAISQTNRKKLRLALCLPHLLQHPFFTALMQIQERLIRSIAEKAIRISVHSQHETIFTAGTEAEETYMVINGSLRYIQDTETSMVPEDVEVRVGKGDWICEAAIWTQWTHVGTLETLTACELLVLQAKTVVQALHNNSYARQVSSEFGKGYHARVQAARPPDADWPNDLVVPYASFPEVMSTVKESVRSFVGQLAVHNSPEPLRASWHQQLREDVRRGRRTAVPTAHGDFEVVVAGVALHLERWDGRVLLQLGTWDGRSVTARCCLPSTLQHDGELPRAAYDRLLKTQLGPLAKASKLRRCSQEVETKSKDLAMRSIMVKHMAHLESSKLEEKPDVDLPPLITATYDVPPEDLVLMVGESMPPLEAPPGEEQLMPIPSTCSATSAMSAMLPELDHGPVALRLFAWAPLDLLRHLKTPMGTRELRCWLASIRINDEVASRAWRLHEEKKVRWTDLAQSL